MSDPKDDAQEKLKTCGISSGRFQHYKGPQYEVFALTIDEATLEPLVHYKSLVHGTSWTRTVTDGSVASLYPWATSWEERVVSHRGQ